MKKKKINKKALTALKSQSWADETKVLLKDVPVFWFSKMDSRLLRRRLLDSVTELYLRHNFISNLWLKMLCSVTQLTEQLFVTVGPSYTLASFYTRQRRLLASSDLGLWLKSRQFQFHKAKPVFPSARHAVVENVFPCREQAQSNRRQQQHSV